VARGAGPSRRLALLLLARAEELLWGMTAVELCHCLWAAAQLQARLSVQWGQAVNHTLSAQMQQLGPGDMCLLLWSLASLQGQVRLQRQAQRQLLVRSQQLLAAGRFTARDMSAFMWNYWRVCGAVNGQEPSQHVLPPRWVAAYCRAMRQALPSFTGRQLGVVLRACVLLGVDVDGMLLDKAAAVVELRSAQLSGSERATISSSLLQLQQRRIAAAELHAVCQPWTLCQVVLPVPSQHAAVLSVAKQMTKQPAASAGAAVCRRDSIAVSARLCQRYK
jgi:hypothetical protein